MLLLTVLKTVIDISVNVEKPTEYETFLSRFQFYAKNRLPASGKSLVVRQVALGGRIVVFFF